MLKNVALQKCNILNSPSQHHNYVITKCCESNPQLLQLGRALCVFCWLPQANPFVVTFFVLKFMLLVGFADGLLMDILVGVFPGILHGGPWFEVWYTPMVCKVATVLAFNPLMTTSIKGAGRILCIGVAKPGGGGGSKVLPWKFWNSRWLNPSYFAVQRQDDIQAGIVIRMVGLFCNLFFMNVISIRVHYVKDIFEKHDQSTSTS